MYDWSSFSKDKEFTDAWRKFLTEKNITEAPTAQPKTSPGRSPKPAPDQPEEEEEESAEEPAEEPKLDDIDPGKIASIKGRLKNLMNKARDKTGFKNDPEAQAAAEKINMDINDKDGLKKCAANICNKFFNPNDPENALDEFNRLTCKKVCLWIKARYTTSAGLRQVTAGMGISGSDWQVGQALAKMPRSQKGTAAARAQVSQEQSAEEQEQYRKRYGAEPPKAPDVEEIQKQFKKFPKEVQRKLGTAYNNVYERIKAQQITAKAAIEYIADRVRDPEQLKFVNSRLLTTAAANPKNQTFQEVAQIIVYNSALQKLNKFGVTRTGQGAAARADWEQFDAKTELPALLNRGALGDLWSDTSGQLTNAGLDFVSYMQSENPAYSGAAGEQKIINILSSGIQKGSTPQDRLFDRYNNYFQGINPKEKLLKPKGKYDEDDLSKLIDQFQRKFTADILPAKRQEFIKEMEKRRSQGFLNDLQEELLNAISDPNYVSFGDDKETYKFARQTKHSGYDNFVNKGDILSEEDTKKVVDTMIQMDDGDLDKVLMDLYLLDRFGALTQEMYDGVTTKFGNRWSPERANLADVSARDVKNAKNNLFKAMAVYASLHPIDTDDEAIDVSLDEIEKYLDDETKAEIEKEKEKDAKPKWTDLGKIDTDGWVKLLDGVTLRELASIYEAGDDQSARYGSGQSQKGNFATKITEAIQSALEKKFPRGSKRPWYAYMEEIERLAVENPDQLDIPAAKKSFLEKAIQLHNAGEIQFPKVDEYKSFKKSSDKESEPPDSEPNPFEPIQLQEHQITVKNLFLKNLIKEELLRVKNEKK